MQKNVLLFGGISGLFISAMLLYSTNLCYTDPEFTGNDVLGYAAIIVALSFIYIGIRNYRNKFSKGIISFGKAFKVGVLITLVASTIYVLVWLVEFYVFIPDFMDHYTEHVLYAAKAKGATPSEISAKTAEMASYSKLYKNPVFVILMTYLEVFPIGVIIALISSLILKRKAVA